MFAHPGWRIDGKARDPLQWMTLEAMRRGGSAGEVDAIELWNGGCHAPLAKLIATWVELLEAGVFVPFVGNSDFHRFSSHELGSAHSIAPCDRPDVETCSWPAVREGRERSLAWLGGRSRGCSVARDIESPTSDSFVRIDIERTTRRANRPPVSFAQQSCADRCRRAARLALHPGGPSPEVLLLRATPC